MRRVHILSKNKLQTMGQQSMTSGPSVIDELNYTIHLTGIVCEESVSKIIMQLQEIEEDNFDETILSVNGKIMQIENEILPVKLYINTDGGCVESGLALISQMKSMRTPIHTYILGKAYSMGLPIFMAGDKRYVSPIARLMHHSMCSTGAVGSPRQIKKYNEFCEELEETMVDLSLPEGVSSEVVAKFTEASKEHYELYFIGKEAYDWGLATDLIDFKPKAKIEEKKEVE